MEIYWRESAIRSLKQLDKWRESIDLPPIANYLKKTVEIYFREQDYSFYIPGREVLIRKMPIDLRIVLISVGASDPYKIFYRKAEASIEIFLIRHPYQKPI